VQLRKDRSKCSSGHLRAELVEATLQVLVGLPRLGGSRQDGGHLRAKMDEEERELAGKVVEATLQVAPN